MGYNVQTAVDIKHHLIVAHEVTNVGNDHGQLSRMAISAKNAMGKARPKVVADRGYYSGPEIRACDLGNISAYVPKPLTSASRKKGLFTKADFVYPRVAYRRRLALIRTGKLDMSLIRTVTIPLHALPGTNEQAAAGNFECVVSEHRE
ncbi:hypothetical protein P3T43_004780 [Paraburkholderia sp. GAS41]